MLEEQDQRLAKLGDFTTDRRVGVIALMGIVAGTGGVAAGWVLLRLIAIVNNLAYFRIWSVRVLPPGGITAPMGHLPLWTVFVPMVGVLIIGLMARCEHRKSRSTAYGSTGSHYFRKLAPESGVRS